MTYHRVLNASFAFLICALLGFYFNLYNVYWMLITVLILTKGHADASFDKGLLRILATLIGAVTGIALAAVAANNKVLYFVLIFCVPIVCCYQYHRSRLPYAWLLAGITTYLVSAYSLLDPTQVYQIAGWRTIEVILGVTVYIAVNRIFPMEAQKELTNQAMQDYLHWCEHYFEHYLTRSPYSPEERIALRDDNRHQFKKFVQAAQNLIDSFRIETMRLSYWQHQLSHGRILFSTIAKFEDLHTRIPLFQHYIDPALMQTLFAEIVTSLTHTRAYLARQCAQPATLQPIKKTLSLIDCQLRVLYQQAQGIRLLQRIQLYYFFSMASLVVEQIECINHSCELRRKRHLDRLAHVERHDEIKYISIKRGIKLGLASVISLFIWLKTAWAGGISGIICTQVILYESTIYHSTVKIKKRFWGCLLGAVSALAILHIGMDSLFSVLAATVLGGGFFVYCQSQEAIGYMGLQAAFAYFTGILDPHNQYTTSIDPPLQRLSGIFIGIIVAAIIDRLVWPFHINDQLDLLIKLESSSLEKWCKALADQDSSQVTFRLTHLHAEQSLLKAKAVMDLSNDQYRQEQIYCLARVSLQLMLITHDPRARNCLIQDAFPGLALQSLLKTVQGYLPHHTVNPAWVLKQIGQDLALIRHAVRQAEKEGTIVILAYDDWLGYLLLINHLFILLHHLRNFHRLTQHLLA